MATGVKPKAEGEDPGTPSDFWADYQRGLSGPPPITQQPVQGVGSGAGGWQVPTVAPNFQFPPGLLSQIQQSLQQPMGYGANFGRFQFSRGTPQPPTAPPGWGRAPVQGTPWGQSPVPGYKSGLLGSGGGTQPGPTMSVPPYNPQQGLLQKAAPVGQQNQGLLTGQATPPPRPQAPIQQPQQGAQPAWQWSPQMGQAKYNEYINQPLSAFMAGFNQAPDMAAKVQYLMSAPPTVSSKLMSDPAVQAALGGDQSWRQNFVSNYYNTPARP